MGRVAWYDNSHEGKLIRRVIDKLAKKLKNTDNTDELIKIAHAISQASSVKMNLAKFEIMDDKVDLLLEKLKSRELRKYVENYANELPQPKD